MSKERQVQLKTSSILSVPIQNYGEDFTFVVNDKEFKTTKLVSDLLSPIICRIHSNDPTIDRFTFNTQQQGDFSQFIKLANFESTNFSNDDIPFLSEVIENLGNKSVELKYEEEVEISIDNVLSLLQQHEKFPIFYCNHISREIDFTSSHFFELCENQEEEMRKLTIDTLIKIVSNDQLRLKSEDQLLKFINQFYSNNSEYTILYETVLFSNVSSEAMKEFVYTYDASEMSRGTWKELSKRLCQEVQRNPESESKHAGRYSEPQVKNEGTMFEYTQDKEYKGIFNYLQKQTGGKIENEVNFTASSLYNNSYHQRYVAIFGDQRNAFRSANRANSWICFDFKEHRVVPTHYTIRSRDWCPNSNHPKSWVIQGSNDNNSWETIDEEKDCPILNGNSVVHTFTMNHPKPTKFKYIRMYSTGPNWSNNNYLAFESFEIYGRFI